MIVSCLIDVKRFNFLKKVLLVIESYSSSKGKYKLNGCNV